MKKMISKVPNLLAYRMQHFKLNDDMTVKHITFYLSALGRKRVSAKKKNYGKFFLVEVEIFISPGQFETLLAEYKLKYGQPDRYAEFQVVDQKGTKYPQKKAMWINKELNRKIYMDKMHDSLTEGFVKFQRYR